MTVILKVTTMGAQDLNGRPLGGAVGSSSHSKRRVMGTEAMRTITRIIRAVGMTMTTAICGESGLASDWRLASSREKRRHESRHPL